MAWNFPNSALNFDSVSIYFSFVSSADCLAAASGILEISDFLDLRVDALNDLMIAKRFRIFDFLVLVCAMKPVA